MINTSSWMHKYAYTRIYTQVLIKQEDVCVYTCVSYIHIPCIHTYPYTYTDTHVCIFFKNIIFYSKACICTYIYAGSHHTGGFRQPRTIQLSFRHPSAPLGARRGAHYQWSVQTALHFLNRALLSLKRALSSLKEPDCLSKRAITSRKWASLLFKKLSFWKSAAPLEARHGAHYQLSVKRAQLLFREPNLLSRKLSFWNP